MRQDPSGDVLVHRGSFDEPVANREKSWIVATKYIGEDLRSLVRINLRTGQESAVTSPSATGAAAIAYLPTHDRILVYNAVKKKDDPEIEETDENVAVVDRSPAFSVVSEARSDNRNSIDYFLLDPATGQMKPVKGEFRPIEHAGMRQPQASSTPGAIWAAIYDEASRSTRIGLYVEKNFAFTTVTTFPDIALRTSEISVHEKENKVYFVYRGHLLAAPLRQQ
jgi:hypothetical protein